MSLAPDISSRFNRRGFLTAVATAALGGPLLAACGAANAGNGKRPDFAALAAASGDPETTSLKYQGQVGAVTPAELAADLGYLEDVSLDWVGNTTSGPQDIQSAATRQTTFGGAFNGAVVKLVAAGAPVTAVISYYGTDQSSFNGYYVLQDSPIRTARDLIGRKVGMNTLGAHYEAFLDIYLQRNGFSRSEIGQVEPIVVPPVNTEQAIRLRQVDVGVLSGVYQQVALPRGGLRMLFSDYQLAGAFSAGTVVLRNDFIRANPNTTRVFVTGVARALEWARTTPRAEVIDRFTTIIDRRKRNESAATLQYWTSYGVAEPGGAITDREIQTWVDWLVSQGNLQQGKLTAQQVYTNAFNPYAGTAVPTPPATATAPPGTATPGSTATTPPAPTTIGTPS